MHFSNYTDHNYEVLSHFVARAVRHRVLKSVVLFFSLGLLFLFCFVWGGGGGRTSGLSADCYVGAPPIMTFFVRYEMSASDFAL